MRKTIKRIVAGLAAFLIIVSIVLMFAGCASIRAEAKEVDNGSMFVCVDCGYYYNIVYHKDTKVMYAISDGKYNRGIVTLLVNADGTPMIWKE